MAEKDYGYRCGYVEDLLATDGKTTLYEVVADEMHLTKDPEGKIYSGTRAGYDFVQQDVTIMGNPRMVYVAIIGTKCNELLDRVDELSGRRLPGKNTNQQTPSVTPDKIEELPVINLPCPQSSGGILSKLNAFIKR